jgi:hypothetical protein
MADPNDYTTTTRNVRADLCGRLGCGNRLSYSIGLGLPLVAIANDVPGQTAAIEGSASLRVATLGLTFALFLSARRANRRQLVSQRA